MVVTNVLMSHDHTDPQDFTSTKSWSIDIGKVIPNELLKKSFYLLYKIDISPRVRADLLKIRHRLTGVNALVSKWDHSVEDRCNFCNVARSDIASCFSGSLYNMLFGCHIVKDFGSKLYLCPVLSSVDLGITKIDRLIYYNCRGKYERFNNIIILLINKYLRDCNFSSFLVLIHF